MSAIFVASFAAQHCYAKMIREIDQAEGETNGIPVLRMRPLFVLERHRRAVPGNHFLRLAFGVLSLIPIALFLVMVALW